MTGISQTTGEIQWARMDEMECDLVETSAHAGARPSHQLWQGRVFSRSGTSKKYPDFVSSTGYGTVTGLMGINCRHSFYPFYEGLSQRAYTDKELEKINNQTVTYNGEKYKLYDATQMQRKMERDIRQNKREIAGYEGIILESKDEEIIEEAQTRLDSKNDELRKRQEELRDFIKQTGLTRDRTRERLNRFDKNIPIINKKSTVVNKNDIMLTDKEKKQLTEYTRFDATRINKAIRLNRIDNSIQGKIDIIDSAIKKSLPLEEDMILHRGTIIQSIKGFENINNVSHKQIMDLKEKCITDRAFISTSKIKAEKQGRNIIMRIKVPKGFKGALEIENYATSKYKCQKEVLLKRNTSFYVKKIKYNSKNKKYYFDMEVIE